MMWSNQQIEEWRSIQKMYLVDASSVALYQTVDQQRRFVQQEMVQLLHSFLGGTTPVKVFNATFQQKTHNEWNVFSLRGLSGGMFFNKLVKYISDEDSLTRQLRKTLHIPVVSDFRYGQRRMQAFVRFLDEVISSQEATKLQLQPARVPFLLSAWWHLQDAEIWPIFYPNVYAVLAHATKQEIISHDPIQSYFLFRRCFLSLAKVLGLSSWEMEHLCTWYGEKYLNVRNVGQENTLPQLTKRRKSFFTQEHHSMLSFPTEEVVVPTGTTNEETSLPKNNSDASLHTHIQWLLTKIGHKVGCQVWIAINDHSKIWKGERLGDLSLKTLPVLVGSEFQRIISRIDVLWIQNDVVVAAYEIEHTTEVYTGLLRLYDLGNLFLEQNVQLCVVAPKERFGRVQFELSRPTFHAHAMRKSCIILAEETLLLHEEHILRWAGSSSIIQDLIVVSTRESNYAPIEAAIS